MTVARSLSARPGVTVEIFEKSDRLGGLLESVEANGLQFDIGTFLFFRSHALVQSFPFLLAQLVPIQYAAQSITPSGTFDRYPFSVRQFLTDSGPQVCARAAASLFYCKLRYRRYSTLPEYAWYHMGKIVYERSGLRNYIKRLHDLPDSEIDLEFAKHRLKTIGDQALRKLASRHAARAFRRFTGPRSSVADPILVRCESGYRAIFDRIRDELQALGVRISTGVRLTSIRQVGRQFHLKGNGIDAVYDRVVSTAPIPATLRLIGLNPNAEVTTRSLLSLFYRGRIRGGANNYFNFTHEGAWKRVTVFSDFYGRRDGDDYFTVEITVAAADDAATERLQAEFERHALSLGLLEGLPRLVGCRLTPNAYPIYRAGQMHEIEAEKQRIRDFGVEIVGRQGNFDYLISHDIAKNARDVADSIGV